MTKVHFHIRQGDKLIRDEEGAEFDDLHDAKREAEGALHHMLAEDIKNERPVQHRVIELTDDTGKILATVEMRAAVKMVQGNAYRPSLTGPSVASGRMQRQRAHAGVGRECR